MPDTPTVPRDRWTDNTGYLSIEVHDYPTWGMWFDPRELIEDQGTALGIPVTAEWARDLARSLDAAADVLEERRANDV